MGKREQVCCRFCEGHVAGLRTLWSPAWRCPRRRDFVARSWPKRRLDDWLNHAEARRRERERCLQMRPFRDVRRRASHPFGELGAPRLPEHRLHLRLRQGRVVRDGEERGEPLRQRPDDEGDHVEPVLLRVDLVECRLRAAPPAHVLSYSSWRRYQTAARRSPIARTIVSLRPRGARSSHWYMPQRPSSPRMYAE
jgi:hypothetical protein